MREQRGRIKALRLHHRHQSSHPFFTTWAKSGHDFIIADASSERVIGYLKFSRINTEAVQGAARPQTSQTVLERLLQTECLDRHIGPPLVRRFTSATTSSCFGSSTTSAPIRFAIFIRTGS